MSGFGGALFLLQVLAVAIFHSSVLLAPSLPSVCAVGGVLGCLTKAVLGPSYPNHSQSPGILQPSHHVLQLSHLLQEVLHRAHLSQADVLSLLAVPAPGDRSQHLCSPLRSPQQPLPSAAPSGWWHQPPSA